MFKINPFIITNYNEMSVIQNSENTIIVKNKDMIKFLNWVDLNAEYTVSMCKIESFFKESTDKAIEFMSTNNLIKKYKKKKIEFNNVRIFSNDEVFLKSVEFNSFGCNENIFTEKLPEDISEFRIYHPEDVYIFFLNPFNFKYYHKLVNILKESNVLSRFSFYYNNSIYLSNYYKKEWNTPCPICFFGNLEASMRAKSRSLNAVSFQNLLDLIYKKDPQFNIENRFTNHSILCFINVILNELNIKDSSFINNVKYIDFNRDMVLIDQAIHWELCDCYE